MPIFNDPTSPIGKSIPLLQDDITRLRTAADDDSVADKAYNLDSEFRRLADHYLSPAVNDQLDSATQQRLSTMLLNTHYYGRPEIENMDDLTAELSQEAQSPDRSLIVRFAQSFGSEDVRQQAQEQETKEGKKGFQVSDIAGDVVDIAGRVPAVAGMLVGGVAGGPVGAGVGAGVGEVGSQAAGRLFGTRNDPMKEQLKDVGTEGVIGGLTEGTGRVFGVIGKALGKTKLAQNTIAFISEKLPSRLTNSILKPLSKEFGFGKNPGKAVVDEGIVAPTRGALLTGIQGKKQEVGPEIAKIIEEASKGAGRKEIDLAPLIQKPIREAMLGAKKRGETQLFDGLVALQEGLTGEFVEEGGKLVAKGTKGMKVTALGAWMEKQNVADGIRWTGQAFDKDLNQVKLQVFRNIKDALTNAVPGSKGLMKRYANLVGAEQSLLRSIAIKERQNILSLGQGTLGAIAGAGSLATGDSTPEAITKGALTALLTKSFGSAGVKTVTAQALKKAIPALMKTLKTLAPAEKTALFQFLQDER